MSATLRRPIAVNNHAQPLASQSLAGTAPRRTELPNDLLEELTGRLGPRELALLGRVSRAWRAAVDDPALWRRHAARLRQPTEGSVATLKAACHYAFHAEANLQAGRVTATRFLGAGERVKDASWSPDGRQVAWGTKRCVRITDARTGMQLAKFGYGAPVSLISWEPVGPRIAVACYGGALSITDTSTRARPLTARYGAHPVVSRMSWSPDGTKVAWVCHGTSLHVTDGSTGAQLARDDGLWTVNTLSWSPDSGKVLWALNGGSMRIVDARLGALLRTFDDSTPRPIGWGPDSNHVAWLAGGQLRTTHLSTGQQAAADVSGVRVDDAFWSLDGSKIFSACADQTLRITDASTGAPIGSPQPGLALCHIYKNLDGTQAAAFCRDTLRVLDTSTGAQLARVDSLSGVTRLAWSPAGARVACVSNLHTLRIVDVNTGANLLQLDHENYLYLLAWSPDGTKVLTAYRGTLCLVDFAPVPSAPAPRPWWAAALDWL